MSKYTMTIHGDGWQEQSEKCSSLQDTLGYLMAEIGWCDNSEVFHRALITVYVTGTDELVVHKDPEESLEDFVVELAQDSKILEEIEKKGVLEWLQLLESRMSPLSNIEYEHEEE